MLNHALFAIVVQLHVVEISKKPATTVLDSFAHLGYLFHIEACFSMAKHFLHVTCTPE